MAAEGAGPVPRLLIAGGGTGGHVFPGMAVAEEIRRLAPEAEILFVGSPGGLEERLVPAAGWRIELVPTIKLRGALGMLRLPLAMARACRAAGRQVRAFRPGAAVALGGYASWAPALACWRRGVPVTVLEQNAIPGRVSRFLSHVAVEVHATYEESVSRFSQPLKVVVSGNPVRRSVIDAAAARRERGPGGRLTLLVVGGSQGARRLNELFLAAIPALERLAGRLRVVHLTGPAHFDAVCSAAVRSALEVETVAFESDMARRYAAADLVLSRAGATGLAEMAVCGLPVVLVPFPFAKDNHQEANARAFERAGAARVLPEAGLTGAKLAEVLAELVEDPGRLARMAGCMSAQGRPDAGARIAARLLELAGAGGGAPR